MALGVVSPLFGWLRDLRAAHLLTALLWAAVLHAAWDAWELSRVRVRLETISRSGGLVTTVELTVPTGPSAQADRYYRTAAVLTSPDDPQLGPALWRQLREAERTSVWSPDLLGEMKSAAERQREALSFIDRAAVLPFDGFRSSGVTADTVSQLVRVSRVCDFRSVLLVISGDSESAVRSIHACLRLSRATGVLPNLRVLQLLVDSGQSVGRVTALDDALSWFEQDDRLQKRLMRQRAFFIDMYRPGPSIWPSLTRPWSSHSFVDALDYFGKVSDAAARPATERRSAMLEVGDAPSLLRGSPAEFSALQRTIVLIEREEVRVKCARQLLLGQVARCDFVASTDEGNVP